VTDSIVLLVVFKQGIPNQYSVLEVLVKYLSFQRRK